MKFFCEYCGVLIDSNKDNKCPSCGASYKKNKTFIKMQEEKNIKRENVEKFVKNSFMQMRIVRIVAGIIFVLIFGIMFISIFKFSRFNNKQNDMSIINFEERDDTLDYNVKVTGYETVEDTFFKAKEGYEFVRFDLIIENKTNKRLINKSVNCIVNGVAQTNTFLSGYSTIPMVISPNLTVKGTATFEVPKDASSYDIRYGESKTIHIDK